MSLLSRKGKYPLVRLYPNSDYVPVELAESNDNNIVRSFSALNIAARPTIPSSLSKSGPEAARGAFPSWVFQRYIDSPVSINFFQHYFTRFVPPIQFLYSLLFTFLY